MYAFALTTLLTLPPLDAAAKPAHRLATPEVREAIDTAIATAGGRVEPWWRSELYLICKREGRCGAEGLVGVHGNDAPGRARRAYDKAVARGMLSPDTCPAHAWRPDAWGTRGLFGMLAAYHVGRVLECAGPEALDDPATAARLAVDRLIACPRSLGQTACSCVDHTRLWVGIGTWRGRPLVGAHSRLASVAKQCGPGVAAWFFLIESGWLPLPI